jgi:hypothetical protein
MVPAPWARDPARDTPELRATVIDWPSRVTDGVIVGSDGPLGSLWGSAPISTVGYRTLRQLIA